MKNKGIIISIVIVVVLGIFATNWVGDWAEEKQKEDLLSHTKIVARTIDTEDLDTLSGTSEDLENPQYQKLKFILTEVKNA